MLYLQIRAWSFRRNYQIWRSTVLQRLVELDELDRFQSRLEQARTPFLPPTRLSCIQRRAPVAAGSHRHNFLDLGPGTRVE